MRTSYIIILFAVVTLVSCTGNKSQISVHERIEMYEDSIKQWGGGLGTKADIIEFAKNYIATLEEAYNEDPNHKLAAEYIDRIHMWCIVTGQPQEALKWAKIVLEKYPKYVNRPMVIESVAALYDGDIQPRDSAKVREYYEMLLKENPKLDKIVVEDIKHRLKFNELSLEEYILSQAEEEENI
ncbi:MAG TPA: hypothetical protein VKZ44_04080 [Taishania sp.]|nr:hypothetical protein [Taishania sp.]